MHPTPINRADLANVIPGEHGRGLRAFPLARGGAVGLQIVNPLRQPVAAVTLDPRDIDALVEELIGARNAARRMPARSAGAEAA